VVATDRYRALIDAAFPELQARELVFLGSGWDSDTVLVDRAFVFRFPRRRDVALMLAVERCLLPLLATRLPLPIPQFDFTGGPLPGYPWHFVGYRMLPGLPLAEFPAQAVDPQRVGRALGTFLHALHDAPVEWAERCGAPSYSPETWVEHHWRLAQTVMPLVESRLGVATARRLREVWDRYRRDPRYRDFRPTIVHADLNPDHVLLDPSTSEVTGIIDFGDVCVADPAIDFTGLPDAVLEATLQAYGRDDPSLNARREALARAVSLHAVHFGTTIGDESILTHGLQQLQRQLDG
jgi:aminoglycoside 2''-phosphotransferase